MPLQIPAWLLFLVPTILALATLGMTYFSLRQKADEVALTLYKDTTMMKMQALEHEIESTRQELQRIKEAHARCEYDLQRLTAQNLDLTKRILRMELRDSGEHQQ